MSTAKVLLTGASSGIGAALARGLLAPGPAERLGAGAGSGVVLGLVARRRERMEALRDELAPRGAEVHVYEADVREAAAMREVVDRFHEAAGGITLAIANAGVSRSDGLRSGDPQPTSDLVAVNLQGTINTLVPAIPHMVAAGGGQLVAMSSVAGFRGIPGKGAYCATKAAQRVLMDAYRAQLRRHGIAVTSICPGWVESELTENNPYPMPFLMDAERAAGRILDAVARRRRTYVFPWQMRLALPLIRAVPDRLLPAPNRER